MSTRTRRPAARRAATPLPPDKSTGVARPRVMVAAPVDRSRAHEPAPKRRTPRRCVACFRTATAGYASCKSPFHAAAAARKRTRKRA